MITAIKQRLADSGLPVGIVDAPAHSGHYVVIYPGPGFLQPEMYAAARTDYTDDLSVMAVSNSPLGVKRLTERVRDLLTGWTPPGDTSQGPLTEEVSGPILSDRVESETRYSLTLHYRAHRRRKAAQ